MKALSLFVVAALLAAPLAARAADRQADVPFITPAGITVTALGDVRGKDGVLRVSNNRRPAEVFADHRGMTLYTSNKDKPGASTCTDACAKQWLPVAPLRGVKATSVWTIISRDDGTKQWAYNGRPVYTSAADTQRGQEQKGAALDGVWQALKPRPIASGEYPFGIAARDVADAGGEVLVDNEGMTLYAYSGDLKDEKVSCRRAPCGSKWVILTAPAVAKGVGDFSVVTRPDGSRQWAHKGRPLYHYTGDVLPEDVNGDGVDKRFQAALVVKYPMPAEVVIRGTPSDGKIFATAKGGLSLYRYAFFQRVQSTDELRAGAYLTSIAQELGTRACTGDCLKAWRPLLAGKNAQPVWHWTLLDRDDGTRQWAYRGHPLFTYVDDKGPGDLNGLNIWDTAINDKDLDIVGIMTKINADNTLPSSFYWTTAYP